MVDNEESGTSRFFTGFIEKALPDVAAVFPPARVRMATDIMPVTEDEGEVCDIAGLGLFRPMLELDKAWVYIGEEVCCSDIHFLMTQIVLAALEDGIGDVEAEHSQDSRDVLFDELRLERDGVGGDDGSCAIIFGEPVKQGDQIGKCLANACAGFCKAGYGVSQ
jgi:hypothetical protein